MYMFWELFVMKLIGLFVCLGYLDIDSVVIIIISMYLLVMWWIDF